MARPRAPQPPTLLRAARLLDVVDGSYVVPGEVLVAGDRIVDVSPVSVPDDAAVVELDDVTLLPGLMDMEVNLLLGGPDHASPLNAVQDDPALRTLRAVANARRTLRAGFTTSWKMLRIFGAPCAYAVVTAVSARAREFSSTRPSRRMMAAR